MCLLSTQSHSSTAWQSLCDFANGTARVVQRMLYGPDEEGADLIGRVTAEGFVSVDPSGASAPPRPKHGRTQIKPENPWAWRMKVVGKALHGILHTGSAACISLAFADWCGLYVSLDGGTTYWLTAIPVGVWMFGATAGNDRLLPADIVTNLADPKISTDTKILNTSTRVLGTGASVAAVAWVTSLSSAHKKELCLENAWALRLPVAYGLATLMAVANGKEFSRSVGPKAVARAVEELEEADAIVTSKRGSGRPSTYSAEGWARGWADFRHRVGNFSGASALVFTLYFLLYEYRGRIAAGRECQERDVNQGLGDPNALQNTAEYRDLLIKAAQQTAGAAFVAAFTFLPWLYRTGSSTGYMFVDYLQNMDPVALGTLVLSMGLMGLTGGAISDHFLEWGLKSLVPLITPLGAAGLLAAADPAVFGPLMAPLTTAFEQVQAASPVYASDVMVDPSNPAAFLTNPSDLTKGLVRTSLILSMLSLTSIPQRGIERVLQGFLHIIGKRPELQAWLEGRNQRASAVERLYLMGTNIAAKVRDNLFRKQRGVELVAAAHSTSPPSDSKPPSDMRTNPLHEEKDGAI